MAAAVQFSGLVRLRTSSQLVSYPDPYSHSCGWITSPLRGKRTARRSGDVIHPAAVGIRVWIRDYLPVAQA